MRIIFLKQTMSYRKIVKQDKQMGIVFSLLLYMYIVYNMANARFVKHLQN